MKKKIRLIILSVCAICFFVIAPMLVFYSMGYRFDFKKMQLTETGGIYVRSFPSADQIIIDSKIIKKPGLFANDVFVQSLIPEEHTVLVTKNNYYDYSKAVLVEQKEVTKLENILLFKKNILFNLSNGVAISSGKVQSPFINQDKYNIKNNSLYYSNATQNSDISAAKKAIPVLKKVVAFSLQGNNILWLATDGFIYKSDISGLTPSTTKITAGALKISKTGTYKIINDDKNIFVNNNGDLLFLNTKTNVLDKFYSPVKDATIAQSQDGANIVYYNDNNIYISLIPTTGLPTIKKNILYKSPEKIGDCVWLNSSYIIFTAGNKIIISEIDYRGEINSITLPQTITISPAQIINLVTPQIFFDQKTGQLYILTNKTLIISEKLTK